MKIYLDNAATTKLDRRVLNKMLPYLEESYANASSIHFLGQENYTALEEAREKMAQLLGADSRSLYFTSGATESNNIALKGVMMANRDKGNKIIVSAIEHSAVLETAKELKQDGFVVEIVSVDKNGQVNLKELAQMIDDKTVMISIMAVNNEIGCIEPIEKIAKLAKEKNVLFHCDATQAIPYLDINIAKWGVDLLSLSAHKFYGPKGVGLFYAKSGLKFRPLLSGGEQENHKRAGTYNVPGIIGMAYALELAYKERDKHLKKVTDLQQVLYNKIMKEIPQVYLNGSLKNRVPANLNLRFHGIEGEAILIDISMKGICVSTGSACSATDLRASYVLKAIGLDKNMLNSNIRFSLGRYNTKKEIDYTIKCLKETVKRLRNFSPIK